MENWPRHAHYMITRTLEHGIRRAEEMREVALTVHAAGLEPQMSQATAERQNGPPNFQRHWSNRRLALLDQMLFQLHSEAEKSKC